jgi:hypothetical protein
MAKKIPDSVCLENYKKLCELFKRVIPDSERYSVVYGCGVDVGMMDFAVVRKTTYTYSNYAIGYDTIADEIAVLPVDRDIEHHGKAYFLKKLEIEKTSQNSMSKEITIQHKQLPQKYIQFVVSEYINEDEDEVVIPIKQDEEAKKFLQYLAENYMEKQNEGILQKIISLFVKQ